MRHTRFIGAVAASAIVLLGACGNSESPARTSSGARASCSADADCEVTTFAGCCACCESTGHAVPVIALSQQRAHCAAKDCEQKCSPDIECPKVEKATAFVARCTDGTCAAVHR